MAVNEHRKRYVAFVIEGVSCSRKEMISAIREVFSHEEYTEFKPWLTVFDGEKGIVRCRHLGKEKVVEKLNSVEIGGGKVSTLVTSGTIKKAKKRLYEDE
ncbi:MAG: hypothetical protein ACQEQM_06220 [Thermoplasmatota archaeon]